MPSEKILVIGSNGQIGSELVEALRKTAGNQTRAAELLKMQVRSLRHLLDKHSIRSLSAQMRGSE